MVFCWLLLHLCHFLAVFCSSVESQRFPNQPSGPGLVQTGHLPLQITWCQHASLSAGTPHRMSHVYYVYYRWTFNFQSMALNELTGDCKTEEAPEACRVKGIHRFLQCTCVKSDRWSRLKALHRCTSCGSETNSLGAVGPSGLCAPQWKCSPGSSLPDSLPTSECYSKTQLTS